MKNIFRFSATLTALAVLLTLNISPSFGRGTRGLATITGTVRDNKGMPLAGAVIQLIREGANQIVKQTYSGKDGNFSARIPAGRYSLKAIAIGFSEVLFSSVTVSPSAEIAYRFNLEPASMDDDARARRDVALFMLKEVQREQRAMLAVQAQRGAELLDEMRGPRPVVPSRKRTARRR